MFFFNFSFLVSFMIFVFYEKETISYKNLVSKYINVSFYILEDIELELELFESLKSGLSKM